MTRSPSPRPPSPTRSPPRSTARGNPAKYTVNFGTGGGGGLAIASITQDEVDFDSGLKQAA